MLSDFIRHYLELPPRNNNVVCLGGGVGTAQILKGLRKHSVELTSIVSMADDGGSAGRLRRAFSIPPPGDIVNCLAALSDEESILKSLLLYRFSGDRYGSDTDIRGQKLGNLIFLALTDIYRGDESKALDEFSKILSPKGRVLPATTGDVNIWAKTQDEVKVYGEENIDLGKYHSKSRTLKEVHLDPPDIKAYKPTMSALKSANMIIVGPGDLFSTLLPVLIVNQIKGEFKKSKAIKVFVVNIANKPFETANFKVSDYLSIVKEHLGGDFFDRILVNVNQKVKIPSSIKYRYVGNDRDNLKIYKDKITEGDFLNEEYPIYHDSEKTSNMITQMVK